MTLNILSSKTTRHHLQKLLYIYMCCVHCFLCLLGNNFGYKYVFIALYTPVLRYVFSWEAKCLSLPLVSMALNAKYQTVSYCVSCSCVFYKPYHFLCVCG